MYLKIELSPISFLTYSIIFTELQKLYHLDCVIPKCDSTLAKSNS